MQHALNSIIGLLIIYGLPVYLLDRRARFNDRPGWIRFAIAFFMLFYFLIVPIFMALALAGPKRPRRSRRPAGLLADHPPFAERYDPRPSYSPVPSHPTEEVQEYDRHSPEASAKRLEEHQLALAKQRKEKEERDRQSLEELLSQDPQPAPSRHSQTRPYLTPQQRREQNQLNQDRRRREREERQAREKQERQDRADHDRQAQNDLFMTWDERGEDERE
jgi:hypothetical protein